MSQQSNNNLQNYSQNGYYSGSSYDQNPQPINSINNNNSTNDQQINNSNNSNGNNQASLKKSNNSNLSNQSYKQKKFKIENYPKQSRTGLVNLGDTSYLNAVLQLLGQIPEFVEFYINRKDEFCLNENNKISDAIKDNPFSYVTYRLFLHLYPEYLNDVEKYKPDSYLRILYHFNPIYSDTKRKNPNDLLIFILNKLDDEMKYKNTIVSNNVNYGNTNCSEEQTIISKVLRWEKITKQKCTQCNKPQNNKLSFFYTFDLDISNTWKNNTGKKNEISINDCLDTYITEKEATFYCQNCLNYQKMLVQSKINLINKNIIFLLDRGDGINNELLNIKFKIEENIDLSKYIDDEKSPKKFELAGIISIDLDNNNKFVCDCKSPIDKKWYNFDDVKVEFNFEDTEKVIEENNKKKLIPYILYYKSVSA